MSDTAKATSDEKLCVGCGAPFGEDDDKRYRECAGCRGGESAPTATAPSLSSIPEKAEEPGIDSEALRIEVDLEKPQDDTNRAYYCLGVTDDAPWHYVTAGGVSFQRYRGEIVDVGEGEQEFRDRVSRGSPIHHLTKKHVERILEDVKMKVVRNYRVAQRDLRSGKTVTTYHGEIHTMKPGGRPFIAQQGDRPLGEFLWMLRVKDKTDYPREAPPTLVRR